MAKADARAKMAAKLSGRTFLARGGNGKLTPQQERVAALTGLEMEYPIGVPAEAREKFESPPRCYKVDLAAPEVKLAVEIDGKSHLTKRWRFLDRRKTEILSHLGWSVLRFWNAEVDADPQRVAETIRSTISKLKERTATSPMES